MRQGRKSRALAVIAALCVLAALPLVAPRASAAGAAGKSTAATSTTKGNPQRQFTGYVTAMDKTTITVEKRGKKPQSRTFTRHAEIQTQGDLARDARVTVYYRDQDGQAIAHRVVVKSPGGAAKGSR